MVLVDTSVFIEFFNGNKNSITKSLIGLLQSEENICICGIIYQEVLQGIKSNKDYKEIKSVLDEFAYINFNEKYFLSSVLLYRSLRAKGITIRKSLDVLIATIAIDNNIPILHNDKDFSHIASASKLKIYQEL